MRWRDVDDLCRARQLVHDQSFVVDTYGCNLRAHRAKYRGCGYATEAAAWTMARAREAHGVARLSAITTPDNAASARVLEKPGFTFVRRIRLAPGDGELQLFESEGGAAGREASPHGD